MDFVIVAIIAALIYFLPSIVGYDNRNFSSLFALNLLLGWTLIGWVVALVWALSKDEVIVRVEENQAGTFENKKCPDCAEKIKSEAKVCKHCGLRFENLDIIKTNQTD